MDNVIITPHSSGSTDLAVRRVLEIFADNLGRYAAGQPLRNEID
jgi:phosphoglycerate dehydrogenase-like enzyme